MKEKEWRINERKVNSKQVKCRGGKRQKRAHEV
jgi:hypothetical protein